MHIIITVTTLVKNMHADKFTGHENMGIYLNHIAIINGCIVNKK